ncbi:alpha-ketoglutarate-dependent dioxygenase AlkB [Kitasatospora sp. NPDC002040]|uniref:alpha-ketoglutarate-dependent dioxygenase AlkB n=1 Tax=Kitasatospora sp. NPDC002040 TaxID=3154661 RepID=UPI00332CFE3B
MPPGPRSSDEVRSYALPFGADPFAELSASARLDAVGKGRTGATLTRVDQAGGVPLVRTTGRYDSPPQRFRAVHERLAQQVREHAAVPADFNNALIEIYTDAYTTMGSHSDQALDLADESFIAVFSCYRDPEAGPPRRLVFESKESAGEGFEIPLTHNGVVVFSVASNRRLRHKIVADRPARPSEHQWLGVTLRTSKTVIRFRDEQAQLPQGAQLRPADEEEQQEFYRLRRRENTETDFTYPPLTYTVSPGDLMPPV